MQRDTTNLMGLYRQIDEVGGSRHFGAKVAKHVSVNDEVRNVRVSPILVDGRRRSKDGGGDCNEIAEDRMPALDVPAFRIAEPDVAHGPTQQRQHPLWWGAERDHHVIRFADQDRRSDG